MIRVLPLRLTFETPAAIDFPDCPGTLWRSALGARLRGDACITRAANCEGCQIRSRCAYGAVFDPAPVPSAQGLVRQFRNAPRPYVISPRHAAGPTAASGELSIDLVLTAGAFEYLPAILRSLARLQINGVSLKLVQRSVVPPGASNPVDLAASSSEKGYLVDPPPVPSRVKVVLEQPLRLRIDNRNVGPENFSLPVFFATLLRRISSLQQESDEPLSTDYASLLDHASHASVTTAHKLHWRDATRYSARQRRKVPLGGLMGSFAIEGDLAPIWPWLWTGQWTHVGKGAVMGLGRYRLDPAA